MLNLVVFEHKDLLQGADNQGVVRLHPTMALDLILSFHKVESAVKIGFLGARVDYLLLSNFIAKQSKAIRASD